MTAFRVANLLERVTLRQDPHHLSTDRLKKAVVRFLRCHLQTVVEQIKMAEKSLQHPKSNEQHVSKRYRQEQTSILEEVIDAIKAEGPDAKPLALRLN